MAVRALRLAALVMAACICACAPPPGAAARSELAPTENASLFGYPWSWTDDGGNHVTFARWRGSPIVVTAIYTQCARTCPFTIEKLRGVEEAFGSRGRAAEFVLATLDPAEDTPARLAEFKTSRRLPASWHLVVGGPEQTQELTDLLDVHVFGADAHIIHDSRIMVFDERGVARKRFTCCDFADADAIPR